MYGCRDLSSTCHTYQISWPFLTISWATEKTGADLGGGGCPPPPPPPPPPACSVAGGVSGFGRWGGGVWLGGLVGSWGWGVPTPPPPPRDHLWFSDTTGILQKKNVWFIGVEVGQETSASPPKKYPGSAPEKLAVVERLAVGDTL